MDIAQILVALFGGGALGVVGKAIVEQIGKNAETRAAQRRSEIDRADAAERRNRILEESLHVHRRVIIDAPCLGADDLPPYPSRKD